MQQWHYASEGEQYGPVAAQEIAERYRQGQLDGESLVWRQGMADWQPLALHAAALGITVAAKPAAPPAAAAPAPAPPPADRQSASPYAPPRAVAAESTGIALAGGPVFQAGFLRRWAALIVDSVLIALCLFLLIAVFFTVFRLGGDSFDSERFGAIAQVVYYGLYMIVAPIYYAGLESSASQATLGKRLIGIKVCGLNGERLSFGHALARWFAAALSYATMYIGFLMAAFTERKQALHDLIASTLVVDRWAYTAFPERQRGPGAGGCLVIALVLILPAIIILGIIAAIAVPAYSDYTQRARGGMVMSIESVEVATESRYVDWSC